MGGAKSNSGLGYNRKPVPQFHWELKSSTLQAVFLCWPASCCTLLDMAWAATTINQHLKVTHHDSSSRTNANLGSRSTMPSSGREGFVVWPSLGPTVTCLLCPECCFVFLVL